MYFLGKLKSDLAEGVSKKIGAKVLASDFEYPPKEVKADLALPLFKVAKKLGKSPEKIAEYFAEAYTDSQVQKVEAKGAYVNFYLKRGEVSKVILEELDNQTIENNYVDIGKEEKVMIEYVSPNSNKPLHLGHLRNGFLGEAISNIMEFCGYDVKRTALINDRGVGISKSMLAYKLYGEGDTPRKSGLKSDHFVGKYYVMYSEKVKENPELEDQIQELVKKWEDGDKEVWDLWKKMTKWALSGYAETYKRLGIGFDKIYNESDLYKEGKNIVEEYLEKGILEKDKKGNVIAKFNECCGLPDKVLLRGDGTAVYATTDLALAKKRINEGYSNIYYVVGSEQNLYFKQLFCILEKLDLGEGQKKMMSDLNLVHLSYGLVMLPEGKMKSREGTVVDADDLLDKLEALVKVEVVARHDFIKELEADERSGVIALAALKFYLLNALPKTTIKFDPKDSISFTGKTGPYVLYSYARMQSILRKGSGKRDKESLNYDLVTENETWALVWDIAKFPEVILNAKENLNPEAIALYAYELSSRVSDFYHNIPVLEADLPERKVRLEIIEGVSDILKKSLALLGIGVLDEM